MVRSSAINKKDQHGEQSFAQAVWLTNPHQVGVAGQYFATSGYAVSGEYVELNAGVESRQSVMIYNSSSNVVFVGQSGAGTGNMLPVSGMGTSISFAVTSGVIIYGLASDSAIADVRVVEIG